uniref:G-protein coupled receptors family 1 profile domain-containing protein n=1 Tax=Clytia hemisphaerica TaxID=252671 RepID=A0A7M5X4T8_9CNID
MANISTCDNLYSRRFHMNNMQRLILVGYNFIVNGVLTFTLNSLVIYTLLKTKQIRKPAMRLILYLSVADLYLSLASPIITGLIYIKYAEKENCTVELILQFFDCFASVLSPFILCLVAYDRYACMKYVSNYNAKMSKKRVNYMTLFMVFLTGINSTLIVIGTYTKKVEEFMIGSIILGLSVFFPLIWFFIRARIMMHRHVNMMKTIRSSNAKFIRSFDRALSRMVFAVLVCCFVCFSLFAISNILNGALYDEMEGDENKGWFEFSYPLTSAVSLTQSALNAIIFLAMNKKSRRFWRFSFKRRVTFYRGKFSSASISVAA